MIGFLTAMGLAPRVAKLVAYIGIPLLILFAFYLALDAYGDSRFREGEAKADREWQEASDRLEEQARASGQAADLEAAERIEDFNERVTAEREALHEAHNEGTDPFDILFDPDGS